MAPRSGRAPLAGSHPLPTSIALASPVSSSCSSRSALDSRMRSKSSSTICLISSFCSLWKTITSSMRLRNSELKKVFRPEFLNRIDDVIVFHKLQREEIKQIVELLLRRIRESMAERELQLELTDAAKDLLVEQGWDPAMGARPLRRAIQRYIEDPLADFVLREAPPSGATVLVDPAPPEDEREVI